MGKKKRKHYAIEKLHPDIKEAVDEMIKADFTYNEIVDYIGGTMTARTTHMLCAYWGSVFMAIHLGMHIGQILKHIKLKFSKPLIALYIVLAISAVIGIYAFITLKFVDYMFGRVQFVFIDNSASVIITILKYLCIMILFAEFGYWVNKAAMKKQNK